MEISWNGISEEDQIFVTNWLANEDFDNIVDIRYVEDSTLTAFDFAYMVTYEKNEDDLYLQRLLAGNYGDATVYETLRRYRPQI